MHSPNTYAGMLRVLREVFQNRYARDDKKKKKSYLDLDTALIIDLDAAVNDKAIRNVMELCEAVFQFAGDLSSEECDPSWEFYVT